jgi:hypothetical protein
MSASFLNFPLEKQADNDPHILRSQLPFCYQQWQEVCTFGAQKATTRYCSPAPFPQSQIR